jgi:hypothetical protein
MESKVDLNSVFIASNDIVARMIEGELIIVPLASGIADMEDELFALNDTGKAIWEKLDGRKTLEDIARELSKDFNAPKSEIERDIIGLVKELYKRKIIIAAP